MTDRASRFANISIRLFQHEGTFRIEVPKEEDFERVAQEFEGAGCTVERETRERCLTVGCPPAEDSRVGFYEGSDLEPEICTHPRRVGLQALRA